MLRPQFHPIHEMEPFAAAAGRRRRRRRLQPLRHHGVDRADRAGRGRGARAGRLDREHRRRPHRRAADPPLDAPAARSGRAGAFRRAPRHVGHVLRRSVHTRHAAAARGRGGAVPRRRLDARRHPGPALQLAGHGRRRGLRVPHDPHGGRPPRRGRGRRPADPRAGRETIRSTSRSTSTRSIRRTRRGRARPEIGGLDVARAADDPPRPGGAAPRLGRRGRGLPALRPRRAHVARRGDGRVRARVPARRGVAREGGPRDA